MKEESIIVSVEDFKSAKSWHQYCKDNNLDSNSSVVQDTDEVSVTVEEAKKYRLLNDEWR